MKQIILVMFISFGLSPVGQIIRSAPRTVEREFNGVKEALINLEKQSWEAWKKRDGKFFEEFLSDDHVEVGFSGTATKAQVVAVVGNPHYEVKDYSLDRFELTMFSADTALLIYHAAQDTTCNGVTVPSPVWVSSLYIKRGECWLNAFYQQTQTRK